MSSDKRAWIAAALGDGEAWQRLVETLPQSELWSLLLEVLEVRARARTPAEVLRQWERDRFTIPATVDQRTIVKMDAAILEVAASAGFETIELSPLAPFGACASVALGSQRRIVSSLRATEVVSDPTNVFALEIARRLRAGASSGASSTVRLGTSHRTVRAQPPPPGPGFAQHFRLFALGSGGLETQNHGFVVDELARHVRAQLAVFDALAALGYRIGDRALTILARDDRGALGDRLEAALSATGIPVTRKVLEHAYYSGGLRFMLSARDPEGNHLPLGDGGSFDWLARLTSNRRAVYVASGMGTQLVAMRYV
jgi:hypothetical protein